MDDYESDEYQIFFCVHRVEWAGVWGIEGENFQYRENMEKILDKIPYKYHLQIKMYMANELRQEIGGGTLAGRERILGNSKR